MKSIFFLIIICFGFLINATAQQLPHLSQYMVNGFFLNPAVAGSKETRPVMLTIRNQWTGFNDAPITQTLSFHGKWFKKMGLGAMIVNDKTGPVRQTGLHLAYAYHLPVTEKTKLSLGLAGTIYQHLLDKDAIILGEPDDDAVKGGRESAIVPELMFGAWFYSEKYYAGFSSPQLFQYNIDLDKSNNYVYKKLVRHYYLTAGYRYEFNEKYALEPSGLLKAVVNSPLQYDLNLKGTYSKMFWIGVSYRDAESVVLIAGATKNGFSVGYSFDATLTNIRKYSSGSHELFISYDIPVRTKKEEALIE